MSRQPVPLHVLPTPLWAMAVTGYALVIACAWFDMWLAAIGFVSWAFLVHAMRVKRGVDV